jgi:hypothetical protein
MTCRARSEPETPCWELAGRINGKLHDKYKVCDDCLVYLLKQKKTELNKVEIENILKARNIT